jgi:hypothetical protein
MDCSRCSSDPKIANKQSAIVEDLCEGHYLYTYVNPLQKERENSEKIVAQLTRDIQHRLAILHKAKNINQMSTEEAARRMLERQKRVQRGELVALGYQYCAKCHAPFESAIERIMHEEDCHIALPRSGQRKATVANREIRVCEDLESME